MTRRTFHLTNHIDPPGKLIRKEYLPRLGISQKVFAKLLQIPSPELTKLFKGQREIDASLAEALGRVLNTSPEFWLMLQDIYNHVKEGKDAQG